MPAEKLSITPNVPQQIALKYTEGKIVEGRFGNQVYFSLSHPPNACLYLDLGPAALVNQLQPAKGEIFNICKRWTGKKTDSPIWDVWPVGDQEIQPAPRQAAVQLRGAVAPQSGPTDRVEVLDDLPVALGERDQLGVKHRGDRGAGEALQ